MSAFFAELDKALKEQENLGLILRYAMLNDGAEATASVQILEESEIVIGLKQSGYAQEVFFPSAVAGRGY